MYLLRIYVIIKIVFKAVICGMLIDLAMLCLSSNSSSLEGAGTRGSCSLAPSSLSTTAIISVVIDGFLSHISQIKSKVSKVYQLHRDIF